MLYEAHIYQMEVEGHIFWVAESKALKGCVGQGDTFDEAIRELEINEKEWIETAKEFEIPIPPQYTKTAKSYSGKIALRVSPMVHEEAAHAAATLGISLNQFINDALISYTSLTNNFSKEPLKNAPINAIGKVVKFSDSQSSSYSVGNELEEM